MRLEQLADCFVRCRDVGPDGVDVHDLGASPESYPPGFAVA